jgi:hypothetical protein
VREEDCPLLCCLVVHKMALWEIRECWELGTLNIESRDLADMRAYNRDIKQKLLTYA